MEGGNELLRVDTGLIEGAGDTTDCESSLTRESGYCNKGFFLELKQKIDAIERTSSAVVEKIDRERNEFKLLEGKYEALRVEKLAVMDDLEVLKRRNKELEEQVRQVENNNGSNEQKDEEEDKVLQLMIENSVLECEKRKAESDVECWKSKCEELQLEVLELNKKLASKAGDSISTKAHCGLQEGEGIHLVEGLQGECNNLAQSTGQQDVDGMEKVDEVQNNAGLDANSFLSDGEEIGSLQSQHSGNFLTKTPGMQAKRVGGNEAHRVNQVRKRLSFQEEKGSNKKMAPSTPIGARPEKVVIIDIDESDDEGTTGPLCTSINGSDHKTSVPFCTHPIPGCRTARGSPTLSNNELPLENNLKMTDAEQDEDGDMIFYNKKVLDVRTPKRKRPSNVIASDGETDDDDDKVPISTLQTKHFCGRSSNDLPKDHSIQTGDSDDEVRKSSRRRLVKLSQCEGKGGSSSDIEEDESDSEGESLDGFIVSGSDISDDDISKSDGSLQSIASEAEESTTDSGHISESDTDYGEIMSRIRRDKSDKVEWEFEADMLAAFGKDPELCMRAVCVLYRQQTSEEQSSKETIFHNQRGFSHCDAFRGSTLAEFLTGGDPQGDLQKSVKQLQAHDPKGIELCRHLATKYSKQLFAIYKNKEDPYFSAS